MTHHNSGFEHELDNELIDALIVEHLLLHNDDASTSAPSDTFYSGQEDPLEMENTPFDFSDDLVDALATASLRTPSVGQPNISRVINDDGDTCDALSADDIAALDAVSDRLASDIVNKLVQTSQFDRREELARRCISVASGKILTEDNLWEMVDHLASIFHVSVERKHFAHALLPFITRLRVICDTSQPLSLDAEKEKLEIIKSIGKFVIAYCRSQAETTCPS
ncbi:MAG: hypothetical protein KDA93_01650 [Planctomycetaceae bacterium]|nr:hypothetical protein [Planctomycetaceae bacterium]